MYFVCTRRAAPQHSLNTSLSSRPLSNHTQSVCIPPTMEGNSCPSPLHTRERRATKSVTVEGARRVSYIPTPIPIDVKGPCWSIGAYYAIKVPGQPVVTVIPTPRPKLCNGDPPCGLAGGIADASRLSTDPTSTRLGLTRP